jgi:hypothetical protein
VAAFERLASAFPQFVSGPAMRALSTAAHAIVALLVATVCGLARGEPLPGRADFLDSPAVIGLGQWQVDPILPLLPGLHAQAPLRLASRTVSGLAALAAPADRGQTMELRAAATSVDDPPLPLEDADARLRRLHGFTDVSLGAQWRVRGGDAGWLPGVAWLADVETTMGSPAFRDRNFRPSVRATAQWALPQHLTLGVMPGLYRDRGDDGRHYAAGVLAVTLGKAWTPRLQSFVELAGQRVSHSQSDQSLLDVDTGLAFVASKTLELDMVVSRSLSGNTSQEVRGGLSVSSRF